MKKILIAISVLLICLMATGCTNSKNVSGTLSELMTKINDEAIPEEDRPMMLTDTEVTSENVEYYLGTTDVSFKEALASESGVGSIAHSVVLVRAEEGQDVEALKATIKANANPNKWICVGADEAIVESNGDLVILIMTNIHTQDILTAFKELK